MAGEKMLKLHFQTMTPKDPKKCTLDVTGETPMLEVRNSVAKQLEMEPESCRLILKGKIYASSDMAKTLLELQIADNSNFKVLKSSAPAPQTAATSATATQTAAPPTTAPPTGAAAPGNPGAGAGAGAGVAGAGPSPAAGLGGMGGLADLFGPGGMPSADMMQQAMRMFSGAGAPGVPGAAGAAGSAGTDGAAGGMDAFGGFNPSMIASMIQNPAVQQMMQRLTADPAFLPNIVNGNPMLQSLAANNPELAQLMTDPERMRTVINPESILSASRAIQQTFGNSGVQNPDIASFLNPSGNQNSAGMMEMMQGMGALFGNAPPGTLGAAGAGASAATGASSNSGASTLSPEQLSENVRTLMDMGFADEAACRDACQKFPNVDQAINYLIEKQKNGE